MAKTKILSLSKPDVTDMYDLAIWNGNTQRLDDLLGPIFVAANNYSVTCNTKVGDYYTDIQLRRSDGTLYLKSLLSQPSGGLFTILTMTVYDTDGLTVLSNASWTLSYDVDGAVIGMTLN